MARRRSHMGSPVKGNPKNVAWHKEHADNAADRLRSSLRRLDWESVSDRAAERCTESVTAMLSLVEQAGDMERIEGIIHGDLSVGSRLKHVQSYARQEEEADRLIRNYCLSVTPVPDAAERWNLPETRKLTQSERWDQQRKRRGK